MAPGLAIGWLSKTYPLQLRGRSVFCFPIYWFWLLNHLKFIRTSRTSWDKQGRWPTPTATRIAVERGLPSLDPGVTWSMLWTGWMGLSWVAGGSSFVRKARAGGGPGPDPPNRHQTIPQNTLNRCGTHMPLQLSPLSVIIGSVLMFWSQATESMEPIGRIQMRTHRTLRGHLSKVTNRHDFRIHHHHHHSDDHQVTTFAGHTGDVMSLSLSPD